MLQPSQIQEVSVRYAREIAEVRGFLQRAGVPVVTASALGDTMGRLTQDASFHRDLGSHAWMLLYAGAGVPEVLQVIAVAAAGPDYAAAANENDAHELLRFVMEARSSLMAKGAERSAVAHPPSVPVILNVPRPAGAPLQETEDTTLRNGAAESPLPESGNPTSGNSPETEQSAAAFTAADQVYAEDRPLPVRHAPPDTAARRPRWSHLAPPAACLLLAIAVGTWMYRKSGEGSTARRAPVESGTASIQSPVQTVQPEAAPAVVVAPELSSDAGPSHRAEDLYRRPAVHRDSRAGLSSRTDAAPAASAYVPTSPLSAHGRTESAPGTAASVPNAAPIVRRDAPPLPSPGVVGGKAATGPVANSVLTARLGSPSVNQADAMEDRVAGTKGYPRLLRRKSPDSGGTLVASASPAPVAGGTNTRSASVPSGTVRSTSLGISAGNLVYAPEPAYPSAAASQHVSGQVTVQAMVDREGNVASARVVSGPPMLRDAAVNAVQQWRYRPFLAGGKPQTFTATAVMDFQLQ